MNDVVGRKPILFYHANCMDGFTAAYVFWDKFKDEYDYHALDYKDAIPVELIEHRKTVFVDICMPKGVMETVSVLSGEPCLVLDHHIGMQDVFNELQESHHVYGCFSTQYSGAGLAWNWLHGGDNIPWFIAAVEDRDLWKFNLGHTKAVLAYVGAHDFDFETWNTFRYLLESVDGREDFAARGNAILQYQNKLIRNACRHKTITKFIGDQYVPTLNIDYSMASDAGHMLAQDAPFAAIYNDEPAGRRYSLRSSKNGGADVCAIAKRYGGGGHKTAAGFLVPWPEVEDLEREFQAPQARVYGLGEK